jgi:hypothetical protein
VECGGVVSAGRQWAGKMQTPVGLFGPSHF